MNRKAVIAVMCLFPVLVGAIALADMEPTELYVAGKAALEDGLYEISYENGDLSFLARPDLGAQKLDCLLKPPVVRCHGKAGGQGNHPVRPRQHVKRRLRKSK